MPRWRILSGRDVLRIFGHFGFEKFSQRGSHTKLRRTLQDGTRQTLTIPLHDTIDAGTLLAIFRQALRFISEADLRKHFQRE